MTHIPLHPKLNAARLGAVFAMLVVMLTACASPTVAPTPQPTATEQPSSPTKPLPTSLPSSLPTATGLPPTATPVPQPTYDPATWQSLPVIPTLSANAIKIYRNGVANGTNPKAFSKIGDCESRTTWFLYDFDQSPDHYSLGEYSELAPVISYFHGSFAHLSLAAKPGFNAASMFATLWADKSCLAGEGPLACEYRVQKSALAFIMLGTNDVNHPETFETNLRHILEYSIQHGVLPILVTKADNLEGDFSFNRLIAALAHEYDIPLWNYWAAAHVLPDAGLQSDLTHLTFGTTHFDDPFQLKTGWTVRNLNALQVLNAVLKAVGQ